MKATLLACLFFISFIASAQEDAATLYVTAKDYFLKGEFEKGLPLAEKAALKAKTEIGETTSDYGTIINLLGLFYIKTQQYAKAEPVFVQARAIKQKFEGEEGVDFITITENLVWVYLRMQQYTKAEPLYLKLREIKRKLLGEDHPGYAAAINDLGVLYFYMGQYSKAEPLLLQSTAIRKKTLGENDPDYATSLNILAAIYAQTGYFEKSELYYQQAAVIQKNKLGENHPDYANTLSNFAALYEELGQYEKAETMLLQAKNIYAKNPGTNTPEYATALNNLGACYLYMSRYEKAEPLLLETRDLRKKILGENSPAYALSLNNLAELYTEMGQYEKADPLYLQTIELRKQALGEVHPEYITSLSNYGLFLFKSQRDLQQAIWLCTEAALKRKKIFGENSTDYAVSLNNLAMLNKTTREKAKTESYYLQASAIIKKLQGEYSPSYATTISNLAVFYSEMGQYKKAEPLLLQVKDIRKKILGETNRDYAITLINLAGNYADMDQPLKAEPLYLQSNKIILSNLLNTFSVLSEKEKMSYLERDLSVSEYNNSFLYNNRNLSAAFVKNNYDLQLVFKSLSLADTKNMLNIVRNSNDTSIKRIFTEWQTFKSILTRQYALPADKRRTDLDQLEKKTDEMEKELNRRSSVFRDQQAALQVTTTEVKKYLQEDEAAIEFVKFSLYTNKRWTDTVVYGAYILRKNDPEVRFVVLCFEDQLRSIFDSAGKSATTMVNSFYRGLDLGKNVNTSLGPQLYQLVWKPIEPYLKGITKISYSPAGKLYSIAFQALPADSGKVLMDKYLLQQYTSTRQVAFRGGSNKSIIPAGITLFGNADFSADSISLTKQKKNPAAISKILKPATRGNTGTWTSLPGTAEEVKKISTLFTQNGVAAKTFTQLNASEENLKAQHEKSSPILHIATHGFFLPLTNKKATIDLNRQNTYSLAEDPLMRSGLILSGGNYVWSGKIPIEGIEDGIATAYEISQLNLSNTELVVLSACETALGDVKGSEGVFGLQRAFKMAGVKEMIVSLWQVPDKETAELMTTFYNYWLKGNSIQDAFAQAQADMRKKYSPFYWAAFVLVE
jgi:CHAT domain-containing protein/Tfp pilus assembly protein PilF